MTKSVTLDGGAPIVQLRLHDATLAEIHLPEDLGRTTLDLAPGVYVARFYTSAWHCDETFLVLPGGGEQTVTPPDSPRLLVDSAAPLLETNGFDPADADIALDASRRAPATMAGGGQSGRLFVLARKRPTSASAVTGELAGFRDSPWRHISLWTADGGRQIDLASAGYIDPDRGLAWAHLALPSATYRLRLSTGVDDDVASQFISVAPGLQTQIFLLDRSPSGEESGAWAAAKSTVYFADPACGFDPASGDWLVAAELLNLIGAGAIPRVSSSVRSELLESASPTRQLAFWLSQVDPWGTWASLDAAAVTELRERLADLPDAVLLSLVATRLREGADSGRPARAPGLNDALVYPPMLTRSWDLALRAENLGLLRVPAGSPAAGLALHALGIEPWMRFRERADDVAAHVALRHEDIPTPDFVISGPEFASFLAALRRRVRESPMARVQFNSSYFDVEEHRLIKLLCPEVDSTVFRILQRSGLSVEEDIPSEESLVQTLRLPRATICQVVDAAVTKLTRSALLPTKAQLDVFVTNESEEEAVLLEPLSLLDNRASDIFHDVEQYALSLLSVVYLRYRSSPAILGEPASNEAIARMLNRLGFVHGPSAQKLQPSHVSAALQQAQQVLSNFYRQQVPSQQEAIVEEIEVDLVPPRNYRPGKLCFVHRRSSAAMFSPELQRCWDEDEFAYSLCLRSARDSLFNSPEPAAAESDVPPPRPPRRGLTRQQYLAAFLQDDAPFGRTRGKARTRP